MGLKNRIILIDDSSSEPILLESAIENSGKEIVLETFDNSVAAVEEMKRRVAEDEEALPNLFLIDLNMPGYNGIELISLLREEEPLRYLPMLIMTSSNLDADTKECLVAGANSVIVKPTGHGKYVEVVKMINDYWFNTVKRIDCGFF